MGVKLYLGVDNCFCSKRWTRPGDWMRLIRDMGLSYAEASADTECDPMYMGEDYLAHWINEVKEQSEKTGVHVAKLYSGHGTYATLGLTHTDAAARVRFRDGWIKKHMDTAAALGAGMGFYAHGIDESVLQSPAAYGEAMETLTRDLSDIAAYGKSIGISDVGLEQMYSPHQPPWTLNGTEKLLSEVYALAGAPAYITLDLGHMNGQQYFLRPTDAELSEWLGIYASGGRVKRLWLGPDSARRVFFDAVKNGLSANDAIPLIKREWEGFDHLFAEKEDGDVYEWVRRFARYSPIMHLQQSDGKSSPHWPFSPERNKGGLIDGKKVLHAIYESFKSADGTVPAVGSIYLMLEPFISTAGNVYDAIDEITESVAYWRQYIPYDGIDITEAIK